MMASIQSKVHYRVKKVLRADAPGERRRHLDAIEKILSEFVLETGTMLANADQHGIDTCIALIHDLGMIDAKDVVIAAQHGIIKHKMAQSILKITPSQYGKIYVNMKRKVGEHNDNGNPDKATDRPVPDSDSRDD